MQIRQLEYSIAVSEHLNFTRAAQQFFISQTAVTLQIRALEEELGVRLFDRTNRRVELTPAGKTFLDDARDILRRTEDAAIRARNASTILTGSFRLGFIKGFEKSFLPDILSDFHDRYPNISLTLKRDNVSELYDGVLNHSLDLAFNLKYSSADLSAFDLLPVHRYPLLAVMPVSHPLAHRTSIRRAELKGYPLVDIRKDETRYGETATIREAFERSGFIPEAAYISDDIETSILAVSAGMGYALLPSYITMALSAKDKVTAVPLEGEEQRIHIVAASISTNSNPILRIFLDEFLRPQI